MKLSDPIRRFMAPPKVRQRLCGPFLEGLLSSRIIAEIVGTLAGSPVVPRARPLLVLLALHVLLLASGALAHEIPSDVVVRMIVKPTDDRLQILVRVPLEAMQDVEFPLQGPGYLDVARADGALRDAALLWLANEIVVYEGSRRLPAPTLAAVRASIPSDRSFAQFETALEHVTGAPLPAPTQLPWRQALLDVLLETPVESPLSRFAVEPRLGRLGLRVQTALQFVASDGVTRVLQIDGDPGVVALDPRWHQSFLRFLRQGFEHILDGADHLLFLLCLIVPFRRDLRALVWIVTGFTAGHSLTLIGSAFGWAPDALWFPPLVETLIAASILYMALENVVSAAAEPGGRGAGALRRRAVVALAFGLVHGFGFSFALRNALQFAGDHVVMALLAFNVGIELGQLLVVLLVVPALYLLFRRVVAERLGAIVISVIVGHTAWHWMIERYAALREYDWSAPLF
jgi:hypothetical protein